MVFSLWVSFVLASILTISSPGPVVTLLITTSISYGKNIAVSMIPGIFIGDFLVMSISLAGVGALLLSSPTLYITMKLLGALYLVYLGAKTWFGSSNTPPDNDEVNIKKRKYTLKAFCVTISNPKSFLFFTAFMSQFINRNEPLLFQIIILAATYLTIGLLNDITYVLLANKAADFLNNRHLKLINRVAAINLIATGIVIFSLHNS